MKSATPRTTPARAATIRSQSVRCAVNAAPSAAQVIRSSRKPTAHPKSSRSVVCPDLPRLPRWQELSRAPGDRRADGRIPGDPRRCHRAGPHAHRLRVAEARLLGTSSGLRGPRSRGRPRFVLIADAGGGRAGILTAMERLRPYPQIVPLETRWRVARRGDGAPGPAAPIDPPRRRFGRLRALVGYSPTSRAARPSTRRSAPSSTSAADVAEREHVVVLADGARDAPDRLPAEVDRRVVRRQRRALELEHP